MLKTVLLLLCSNSFMTIAWYGHLKYKAAPLLLTIAACWLIALPEYCFQVPANRLGHLAGVTAPQLKILQEAISIAAFLAFNLLVLKDPLRWTDTLALALVFAGISVMLAPKLLSAAG